MRIENIKRHNGVADSYSYTVEVTYPGEETSRLEFVGSSYGGPIVLVLPSGTQTFVRDPGRFGDKLNPEWVRRFFAGTE